MLKEQVRKLAKRMISSISTERCLRMTLQKSKKVVSRCSVLFIYVDEKIPYI